MSEGESLMMKTARAFLKETIRSARTLDHPARFVWTQQAHAAGFASLDV